jgi:pilus assembly protein Flp/PilA
MLKKLFKDERGQDMIEYALLAAFISIAAITIISALKQPIVTIYTKIQTALTGAAAP